MKSELKDRIRAFIGDLSDDKIGDEALIQEAKELYGILIRKPGRQPGNNEASKQLADAGPSGKELSE